MERVGRNVVGSSLGGMWDWGGALGKLPCAPCRGVQPGEAPQPRSEAAGKS